MPTIDSPIGPIEVTEDFDEALALYNEQQRVVFSMNGRFYSGYITELHTDQSQEPATLLAIKFEQIQREGTR